jgi:hypothetical protein
MALTENDQAVVDLLSTALETHDCDRLVIIAEMLRKRAAYEKDLAALAASPEKPQSVPSSRAGRMEGVPSEAY